MVINVLALTLDLVMMGFRLVLGTLGKFVSSSTVTFTREADNQWLAVTTIGGTTNKGNLVIGDLTTIIHYGLDIVAQLTAWFAGSATVTG